MKVTPFIADHEADSPRGVSIEIDGLGADFYSDGTFYPWQEGNGMFVRGDDDNPHITPQVPRELVFAAFEAAKNELGVSFEFSGIGVFVDAEGNVDPLNEIPI